MILLSWWVLYRVAKNRLRQSSGKVLSTVFFVLFLLALALQVYHQAAMQRSILLHHIDDGPTGLVRAAGHAAAVFFLDVLGLLLLLPPAMIRADGIIGKQRAAVDTELWLTLPLSARQQLAARLAQATFFLSFLAIFFLSHFIGPAVCFTRSAAGAVLLFLLLALTAALCVLGGGVTLYALVRRYLQPRAQGRLVAWSSLGIIPVLYASFTLVGESSGGVTDLFIALAAHTPLAGLFSALHKGRIHDALSHAGVAFAAAAVLALCGWRAVEALGREAVDDLAPLGASRRYPTRPEEDRPLSHLAKDLRLRLRDPIHRGAFIGTLITSLAILLINALSPGPLVDALRHGKTVGPAVMVVALLCGITALLSASQWVPLEARALEFLRTSGIEPPWLVVHKGLCATVEVLLLCLPACLALVIVGGSRMLLPALEIALLALCLAWFVVGDSAARFPQARRDTRPFQMRTFMASYLIAVCGGIALSLSHGAALATLVVVAMGALGRVDAGIDALTYLDDTTDPPRRVRFADAWLAGAAAVVVQGLVALILGGVGRWHGASPLMAIIGAYSASALLLGGWSVIYLRRRLPRPEALLGPPPGRGGYLWGLALGLLSAGAAALYLLALRRWFPTAAGDTGLDVAGAPLWARLLTAGVVVTLDPLAEETFFRGWVLRGLDERLKAPWVALVLQAVLFAALHPALSYLPVGVLGLCAGLVVRRTGSVRPAVLVHAVHNALPALLMCLGKG